MSVAYIGIGSNLGNRQKNIELALEKLKSRKNIEVREVSSIIETEPVGEIVRPQDPAGPDSPASGSPASGSPAQAKFLNAACRLETALYPDELLGCLKSIERELGRREDSFAPRLSREEQLKMLQQGNFEFGDGFSLSEPRLRKPSPGGSKEQAEGPKRWTPRTIDLDLLFYDDVVMKGTNLIIPHPLLHRRWFVLKPLAEIAPDFIHPVLKKSINDLLLEYESN